MREIERERGNYLEDAAFTKNVQCLFLFLNYIGLLKK
jgi:hypothetical protein